MKKYPAKGKIIRVKEGGRNLYLNLKFGEKRIPSCGGGIYPLLQIFKLGRGLKIFVFCVPNALSREAKNVVGSISFLYFSR